MLGGEVLETSPPTFQCAIKTTRIKSRSLKVKTACALSVASVVSVVQAAMHRVSGGWDGTVLGAKIGAVVGASLGPLGIVAGSIVGGVLGGWLGGSIGDGSATFFNSYALSS